MPRSCFGVNLKGASGWSIAVTASIVLSSVRHALQQTAVYDFARSSAITPSQTGEVHDVPCGLLPVNRHHLQWLAALVSLSVSRGASSRRFRASRSSATNHRDLWSGRWESNSEFQRASASAVLGVKTISTAPASSATVRTVSP